MLESKSLDHNYFEQIIIYNSLVNEEYLSSIIPYLKSEFFHDKDNRAVINLITDYYQHVGEIPSKTEIRAKLTSETLRGSFAVVLNRLKTLDKKYNKDELYEHTEQFLKEKAVYTTLQSVIDDCSKGNVDSGNILKQFDESCSITLNHDLGMDYFNDIDRHVKEVTEHEKHIPTGFPSLDTKLGGGWLEDGRALYIFAGETNVGKSIFLGNCAVNLIKQGKNVVIVSLEMSEKMYSKRISSNLTRIPINELGIQSDRLRDSLTGYKTQYGSRLIIKEFPPSTITPSQLKTYLKKVESTGIKIDAVVIDYINLLATPGSVSGLYEKGKYISEQVRALSYMFGPVISATQLNRSGYGSESPELESISESYALGATADVIMVIWQPEDGAEMGIVNLGIVKNRMGPNYGTFMMDIEYPTLSIKESDVESDTDESVETNEVLSNFASEFEIDDS